MAQGIKMKICIFSDTHYCQIDKMPDGRLCSKSLDKIKEIISFCKKEGIKTLICLGDLMHIEEEGKKNEENFSRVVSLINESGLDFILVPGNIDSRIMNREEYIAKSGFTLAPCILETPMSRLIFLDASYSDNGEHYKAPMNEWQNSFIPDFELEFLRLNLEESK